MKKRVGKPQIIALTTRKLCAPEPSNGLVHVPPEADASTQTEPSVELRIQQVRSTRGASAEMSAPPASAATCALSCVSVASRLTIDCTTSPALS